MTARSGLNLVKPALRDLLLTMIDGESELIKAVITNN